MRGSVVFSLLWLLSAELASFTLTIGGVPLRNPLVVWGKAPR
jgi:hypothetical protein